MVADRENQLELFEAGQQPTTRTRRVSMDRMVVALRHDQAVVAGIAGLLGVTIVFAGGVERGKHLVRGERALLAKHQAASLPVSPSTNPPTRKDELTPQAAKASSQPKVTAPAVAKPATKLAASTTSKAGSRYAIQVVTYSRPQLARKELERLHARGERAFLVMRDGRTMVFVGPFPSKGNASEKLAVLKSRYQDCFVKTL